MKRRSITCRICGARCACRKASESICCTCHKHKGRRLLPDVVRWDRELLSPAMRAEIEAIERERAGEPVQVPMPVFPPKAQEAP